MDFLNSQRFLQNFMEDPSLQKDSLNYLRAMKAIEYLTKCRAQISLRATCSIFCSICSKEINQIDYKQKQFKAIDCDCKSQNYHTNCLGDFIMKNKDSFTSVENILKLMNEKFNCENCKTCRFTQQDLKATFNQRELQELQDDANEKIEEEEEKRKKELEEQNKVDQVFECPVCMDDIDNFAENGYTLSCGHSFCKDCLFGDFKNRVEGSINFSLKNQFCPQEGCKKQLIFRDFENVLKRDTNVLSKLEQKNINSEFEYLTKGGKEGSNGQKEILITCPGMYIKEEAKKEMKLILQEQITKLRQGKEPVPPLVLEDNQRREICGSKFLLEIVDNLYRHKCSKCKYEFCIYGCDDIHVGHTCSEYQQWKMDENKDYRKEYEAQGLRFCPNCNVITERTEGCNRITCSQCEKSYCYTCYFLADTQDEVYDHLEEVHGGYD